MKNFFGGKSKHEHKPCKVFGVGLEEVCEHEQRPIPTIAIEAIEFLELRGLTVEGLFRIPGNSETLDMLKAFYDGDPNGMRISACVDVHAVAGLLKLYLRELPDPLLTHRFYSTFIAVQKHADVTYRMMNIRKLVNALPQAHKFLLTRLCEFLMQVAKHAEQNKMSEANLAIVFGPNLLRPQNESMLRMIQDARHVNGVVRALLEEYEFLVTCTTLQPRHVTIDLQQDINQSPQSPPLPVKISIQASPAATQPGSKRRAFKFEVSTSAPEQNDEELAKSESPVEPLLPKSAQGLNLSLDCVVPPNSEELKISAENGEALGFDLESPLEYATQIIVETAAAAGRPMDISLMTPEQQREEKIAVKRQLRNFDVAFKSKFGHLPAKKDKEPLRPLYQRYRDLSKLTGQTDPDVKPVPLEDNMDYKLLKKEKRQLQLQLHQYQSDFLKTNGRPIKYVEDRVPVQKQYDRYKELKALLQNMEENYKYKVRSL